MLASPVKPQVRSPHQVVFWGIIDCKYDAELPPDSRVQVLELGDSRRRGARFIK